MQRTRSRLEVAAEFLLRASRGLMFAGGARGRGGAVASRATAPKGVSGVDQAISGAACERATRVSSNSMARVRFGGARRLRLGPARRGCRIRLVGAGLLRRNLATERADERLSAENPDRGAQQRLARRGRWLERRHGRDGRRRRLWRRASPWWR